MTKAAKDNLNDHLWPYSDEDIAIIREEKTQLVTAAEFAEVHMEKLCLEKKLATAVEALKNAYGEINSLNGSDSILEELEQTLAEIGGKEDE